MTDQHRYFVEVFPPTYTVERPNSLWRHSADGWEYLSLVDWSWHSPDASRGLEKPPDDYLVAIDAASAERLAADRRGWFHSGRYTAMTYPPSPDSRLPSFAAYLVLSKSATRSSDGPTSGRAPTSCWTMSLAERGPHHRCARSTTKKRRPYSCALVMFRASFGHGRATGHWLGRFGPRTQGGLPVRAQGD